MCLSLTVMRLKNRRIGGNYRELDPIFRPFYQLARGIESSYA